MADEVIEKKEEAKEIIYPKAEDNNLSAERIAKGMEALRRIESGELVEKKELELKLFQEFEQRTKSLTEEIERLKKTQASDIENLALRLKRIIDSNNKYDLKIKTEGRSDVYKMMAEVMEGLKRKFPEIKLDYDGNVESLDTHFANFSNEAERLLLDKNKKEAEKGSTGSVQVFGL